MSELSPELKALQTEIVKTVTDGVGEVKDRLDIHGTRLDRLEEKYCQVYGELTRPGGLPPVPGGSGSFESAGRKLVKQADTLDLLKKTGRATFAIGSFFPTYEEKTLIDSAALGDTTPGVLGSTTIAPIVPLPRRRLTVADLLRSRPITDPRIQWIQEASFTNAASPQTEGDDKAESAMTFQIAYDDVTTVAHWVPVTRQALDDLPELRRFIDENLIYGLKLKEETEILSGDNAGDHLNGLVTQAGAYAGTYNAASDTYVDKLRHAILELEVAEETVSGIVLNPIDWHTIELIKDEAGGANTGKYIITDPATGTLRVPTLWGRPVVTTNSMTQGKFLCGDFSAAMIGRRMDATVDISFEHDTYFIKNKCAIRAESRLALAVLRTSAFLYGSF